MPTYPMRRPKRPADVGDRWLPLLGSAVCVHHAVPACPVADGARSRARYRVVMG
jgi:hypothetical protein